MAVLLDLGVIKIPEKGEDMEVRMPSTILLACLLLAPLGQSQVKNEPATPSAKPELATPTANLIFSEPRLDSPLAIPSLLMGGAPRCSSDGTAFWEMFTPPPRYRRTEIFSVSPRGLLTHYATEQIDGLTDVYVTSFDPGISNVVMLLSATATGESRASGTANFIGLFDYDGKLQKYSRLELGFHVFDLAQLGDNSFFVMGADDLGPRFVLIDDVGAVLRNFDAGTIAPSERQLASILRSISPEGGPQQQNLPPLQKFSVELSLLRTTHWRDGLLILQMGADAQMIRISVSGEVHKIPLHLPSDQLADSMIADKARWFVRAYPQGGETTLWNMYELDPNTGNTIRQIATGVPPTSLACPTGSGFYGFRWIEHKPYLIFADLK
jgi:hypothetical protein